MPADTARRPTSPSSNRALLVAGLGIFMVFLDTQILFVAFADIRAVVPRRQHDDDVVGPVRATRCVFAALLVPAGRLADRWGRKSVFLGGLARVHHRLGGLRAGPDGRRC